MNTKTKILVVEDSAEDLELLLMELRNSDIDFEYHHVVDEESFMRAMAEHEPDIIISDHNLPSFTSLDAMSIARGIDPEIPFIVLSGYIGEEEAVDLIVNKGANDFILKSNLKKVPFALRRELENKRLRNEISLQNKELEKLSVVARQAINGVLITDPNGLTEWVNNAFSKISGYEPSDIIGKKPGHILQGPETDPETIKFISAKIREQVPFSAEILNYRKDGNTYWNKLDITPIFTSSGDLIRFIGIQEDITDKRRAKDLLISINDIATSLLNVETLEEISQIVTEKLIKHFDLHDCVIYKVNPDRQSLTQIAAYGDKSGLGSEVLAPLTLQFGQGIVGTVAKTATAEIVADTSRDDRYVVDDKIRLSELAVPILIDDEVIGVLDTEHPDKDFYTTEDRDHLQLVANMIATKFKAALDRLEKHRVQEQLIQQDEQLRNLTDSVDGIILRYLVLPDGTDSIPYISEGVKKIFGIEPEEIIEDSSRIWSMIFPADIEKLQISIQESARSLSNWVDNYRITTTEGVVKWIHGIGTPERLEDGTIAWNTLLRDITEQVNLQIELQESLNEKEFLLGEIHHRVKNNLAIVSGLLELQGMETDNEQIQQIIGETSRRIKSIGGVHELLYNSDNFTDISIKQYVEKLAGNIRTSLTQEDQEFHLDIDIDKDIQLNINQAVPIGLLLNELITNSLKYAFQDNSSESRITIRIEWINDHYHVFYADSGKGFDAAMIKKPKSLGFTLINTTLQQLHAKTEFKTDNEFSLSFRFDPNRIGSHSRLA